MAFETAIQQLKRDFIGRCDSDSPRVRAFYFGTGQLLFNFWLHSAMNSPSISITPGFECLDPNFSTRFAKPTSKRQKQGSYLEYSA